MAGRTYRYFKGDALYPFGYGLSFTDFSYSNLKLSAAKIKAGQSAEITVDVTNTGKVKGDEIVQLYLSDKTTLVVRPVKELKSFERITLDPGQTKTVKFIIDPSMLSFWDADMKFNVKPGEFEIMIGKSSAEGIKKILIVE
jgi:beta-glucosidase